MRIALTVAGSYPAFRGSQVLVQHLARGLEQRGHQVHLVTYGDWLVDRPGPSAARIVLDVWLVARLWRVVRREAIDVIHAHNYEAAIAGLIVARMTGRPLVYHGHSALEAELPTYARTPRAARLLRRLGRLLDTHVPRRADYCIAVSEELGEVLRGAGVPADGLACIIPAGAPHELTPCGLRSRSTGLVCYAGNLDGYQNLDFLLRSFARVRERVPSARLVLVTHERGRGGARLRSGEPRAGVDIVCAGSYAELRARLDEADVAVCPRSERSGFPMKLLSYMAAGKAIVASQGSGKGLRDGVTGRLVPDGDQAAFAAAILELLADAPARAALGAAARRAVEDGGAWERVLDRIEVIYRRLLARDEPALVPVACAERGGR